jgi:DNA repair exonuclease SbcCD ATPase subunit
MAKDDTQLPAGETPAALQSGEDLALNALAQSAQSGGEDEVAASDKVAETLTTLQGLVERRALELEDIKKQLKEHRSSLRNVFENDPQLSEAQAEMETHSVKVKERKTQLQTNPEATGLKTKIAELREQQKELEETLSNHLVNYHSLTNSNSFDTSDGDQWEFTVTARIKPRKKHQEE